MAKVLHGDAGGNQLNASENKTQVYGLKGNDTLISDNKSDVLLVGGSGDDSLIMLGGNGSLSGGEGSDVFELNYSADKKLSAVIEDLNPSEDKILVKFDGSTAPQLTSSVIGNDVVWKDSDGNFNVTLKSVRDNDYFDDEASDEVWEILEFTNQARENANASLEANESLSALTMSNGLTAAAKIRVQEITELGEKNELDILKHIRPNRPDDDNNYDTVFEEVGKEYHNHAENITAGESTAKEAVDDWMDSPTHRKNILDEEHKNYLKLGVGYNEDDTDPSDQRFYWLQLFADSLNSDSLGNPETVTSSSLLTANIETDTVTKFIQLTDNTIENSDYGVTISGTAQADSINNAGLNVSISGGANNDTIENSGSFTTIFGSIGDDQINLSGDAENNLIEYFSGDGSDTISGLNSTDTLSISGSEFTPATVGNNIIVGVGSDSITLSGAASSGVQILGTRSKLLIGTEDADYLNNSDDAATIQAKGGDDYIYNYGSNVSISADTGDDYIYNYGSNVSISAGADDDYIYNSGGENVLFFHDSGNDTIGGFNETSTLKIAGGNLSSVTSGDDLILLGSTDSIKILDAANFSSINILDANDNPVIISDAKDVRGTEQADNLRNAGDGATIRALGGDDTIDNSGDNVSISGGAGNDSINNNQKHGTIYIYESGNDTIEGFNYSDSLDIGDYAWETLESGNDIIVNIISNSETVGSVTLKDYPSDQEVNILSTYELPKVPGEKISNSTDSTLITGTANDDTITNYSGDNVTIQALGGNDSVDNHGNSSLVEGGFGNDTLYNYVSAGTDDANYSTVRGGDGNDFIDNHGNHALIEGGAGNDTIDNYTGAWRDDEAEYSTLLGGDGNDLIENVGSNVSIDAGTGNDSIDNDGNSSTILSGAGNDSIDNSGDSVTIDGSAGDDFIWDFGSNDIIDGGAGNDTINSNDAYVTIEAGDGDDDISNWGDNVSILGDAGNDSIWNNNGSNVSIVVGAGKDFIYNDGSNVSILGGDGNDLIRNEGSNVSILGGDGNDQIDLFEESRNNFIRYAYGDGNDTIWGITENDTLNILADSYSTIGHGEDIIVRVGEGEILLVGARNKPPHITIGESGSTGGNSGNGGNGGSSGNGGRGGNDGGSSSGGTSANEGRSSDASGGQSATGSSGRSASSGGNDSGSSIDTSNFNFSGNVRVNHSEETPAATFPSATMTPATPDYYIYSGGNQVISDYQPWKKIIFDEIYTESFYDGAGNFLAGSSTGALAIENATDRVIEISDRAGNPFLKAYLSGEAGVVDGRGLEGYEIIHGSLGEDLIYAGDHGSQLWGNADNAVDSLVGGAGSDFFVGGMNQGADLFFNVSSADAINLNDATLENIVATYENEDKIAIAFDNGNIIGVQSSEAMSGAFVLADGSVYRYNHINRTWQNE